LVNWFDAGRSSARAASVDLDGAIVAPGVTSLDGWRNGYQLLVMNRSSMLRYDIENHSAFITLSNTTTTMVDVPSLADYFGAPSATTNGEDFLVAASTPQGLVLVRIKPDGTTSSVTISGDKPSVTFDGANYLVSNVQKSEEPDANGHYEYTIRVVSLTPDLTAGTPKPMLTVRSRISPIPTLVSGGDHSLLVWSTALVGSDELFCSRVSRHLELLDAPGVRLGESGAARPGITWDGASYWVTWPKVTWVDDLTYLPAVQLVSPDPVDGNVLLLPEPVVVSDRAIGGVETAVARPGGPVLFVMSPYAYGAMSRMVLWARPLREGAPTFGDAALREHLVVRPKASNGNDAP
jgi:hypothetical protein